MPRTKKAPTSPKPGSTATKGPNGTPKSSTPSVAPSLEERVAALERAVMTLAVHLPAALFDATADADRQTRRLLEDLESRFNVAGTLARLRLPEEAFDDAFEEWEALPKAAGAAWEHASRKLADRLVQMGLIGAAEERVPVPLVTIDADAVHRTRGLMPKGEASR